MTGIAVEQRSAARDEAVATLAWLRSKLLAAGWRTYKVAELISPSGRWTIRTGYSGGRTHVVIRQFNQAERDRHVADDSWWAEVGRLDLTGFEADTRHTVRAWLGQFAGIEALPWAAIPLDHPGC